MSNITLIGARAGITNYYQNQVVRNQAMDIKTPLIDALTFENHGGGINGSTLMHAAVMSAGLNAQASGVAQIQGGWGESKGLLLLDFTTQTSPVLTEYMHVLGYVSNNQAMGALSADAMFHPVMSWKTQETITSNMGDIMNPTNVKREIGKRTDYMFNDGSNMANLVTLRPSDVIEYGLGTATNEHIQSQIDLEGLDGQHPISTPAASSLSRVGVITSKRDNTNPINYSMDILKAGTNYQRNSLFSSNNMSGETDGVWDGMFSELTQLSYQSQQGEPQLLRDDFFREMMQMTGNSQSRGFTGYSIGDLDMAFGNLDEVLDLTFMDAGDFVVDDFTQNTEGFGTSSLAEITAAEIEANMLDLMLKYGLMIINFRGSNCDNFGDGGLDNIVIFPYAPTPIQEDDYQLGQKVDAFVEALRSQIFTKLNGLDINQMVPIRFDVQAELFGTTAIDLTIVNDSNIGNGFMMENAGASVGIRRMFPTFAINTTSPVLGTSESAQEAGSNFFSNIQSYFS